MERISKEQAFKYWATYQRLRGEVLEEKKNVPEWTNNLANLSEEEKRKYAIFTASEFGDGEQYVKDMLFIEEGEDVEDMMKAFTYYKCDGTA